MPLAPNVRSSDMPCEAQTKQFWVLLMLPLPVISTHTHTDRQTDRQTETDRQTDRQTDRDREGYIIHIHAHTHTHTYIDIYI